MSDIKFYFDESGIHPFEPNVRIEYLTDELKDLISPKPLTKFLPNWYKKTSSTMDEEIEKNNKGFLKQFRMSYPKTVKVCVPFFDYLTSGYVIPAWAEFTIKKDENGILHMIQGVEERTYDNYTNNNSHGFYQYVNFTKTKTFFDYYGDIDRDFLEHIRLLKLLSPWKIKTDDGVSCLFTRPFMHDNKINIFPGIVDTDVYEEKINYPFNINLKFGEKYEIKIGDPLILVFPFKREEFKSQVYFDNHDEKPGNLGVLFKHGYYRRFLNKKKKFL